MKPTFLGLMSFKLEIIKQKWRKIIFKLRGLQIGKETVLGNISCNWPHLITIGSNCDVQDQIDCRLSHAYSKNNVFIGDGCKLISSKSLKIGIICLISCNTVIVDSSHKYFKSLRINMQPCTEKSINICKDVWIGTSCLVLQGVTIGKGCVIAAGSIINKYIPEYEVWGGVPARFIKKRE